jgi:DNA-binding transcriptional ArsR family regulator
MVRNGPDMTEHPDDILRALADPERLRIAGALAAGDAAAKALSETLELPLARVRRHLTRLAAAGVARVQPDHRTYRLDRDTLRWAAEQVGPPRDAGIALGAANEDEEAVLRAFFRDGVSPRSRRRPGNEGSSSSGSHWSSSRDGATTNAR